VGDAPRDGRHRSRPRRTGSARVDVSEFFHFESGQRQPGLDPDRGRYTSFASFGDPDGNIWLLQEA